jgi:hypothetical protein
MAVWRDQRPADLGDLALMSRRFPASRRHGPSKGTDACFIVRDGNRQALAYARALLGSIQTELLQICKLLFEAE